MDDLALQHDLFVNSEETKLLICTMIFWSGDDLQAKFGHYRNTCLVSIIIKTKIPGTN